METVTEALQSAVDFQTHLKGLEKAQSYLLCIQKAKLRAQRKLNDANTNWFSQTYAEKCLRQATASQAAAHKLNKSYKRQLFNLFYKSKF